MQFLNIFKVIEIPNDEKMWFYGIIYVKMSKESLFENRLCLSYLVIKHIQFYETSCGWSESRRGFCIKIFPK